MYTSECEIKLIYSAGLSQIQSQIQYAVADEFLKIIPHTMQHFSFEAMSGV